MKYNCRRNIEGNERKTLNPLKVPIFSPTVYRPLILLSLLHCLLQCSGAQFIKKFMIQILDSNSFDNSPQANVTELTDESNFNIKTDDLDYALPLVILSVRLAVIFLMAFLVKKLRVRFLYFLSLFTTLKLLVCLALISDPALIGLNLSDTISLTDKINNGRAKSRSSVLILKFFSSKTVMFA